MEEQNIKLQMSKIKDLIYEIKSTSVTSQFSYTLNQQVHSEKQQSRIFKLSLSGGALVIR